MNDSSRTFASCLQSLFAHDQFEGMSDPEVLRQFLETRSGDAFSTLMRRQISPSSHIGWIQATKVTKERRSRQSEVIGQRDLQPGYTLDGAMCVHMANDPETYKRMAREALRA